jgi:homocitrate synthase NifV
VLALKNLHQIDTHIITRKIPALSALVEQASGRSVAWQKSVVGAGVFTHEAGIHVDGLLKDRNNYQGLDPADVGRDHSLVLGKHSGVHMVHAAYRALGITLDQEQARRLLACIRHFSTFTKRSPTAVDLQGLLHDLYDNRPLRAGGQP